ncbi:MAG: DEAD/DEAH box helicase, partial [Clostridia bacterium]|nr:DEAD/DEAH box helicase [Clostridia bacterium]
MELSELKGLGKTRLKALNAAGVFSLRDLLCFLPTGYRDTTSPMLVAQLQPGQSAAVCGAFKGTPRLNRFKGMNSVTATFCDESGSIACVWYNQPWLQKQLDGLQEVLLYGRVEIKNGRRTLMNPTRETAPGITPVYKTLPGLPDKVMRDVMIQALAAVDDCCPETLPSGLRMRYSLCEMNFAIRQAHFPDSQDNLRMARRRIAFEQALLYQAGVSLMSKRSAEGIPLAVEEGWQLEYWQSMPFGPTGAQRRVLSQIVYDLQRPTPMARLVQGDVGCGKTAIAFGALYLAARAGFQGAMMAPTEILARQHLQSARAILEPLGIRCGLLLGGMKAKERREALEAIASGAWQVVIGTHALISEGVRYKGLGLVVTDEQHRFGVRQRSALADKAERPPHVLVMSATPIPRTLAL